MQTVRPIRIPSRPSHDQHLAESVSVLREIVTELTERIDILEARELLNRNCTPAAGTVKVRE